ncbi:MAG TPA: LuxR C-terminal-related transcriptional regulator, partial [Chloroflexota bacterium]|nr:LuxR C-terminal-related transcriptional regulator [Chloroflexota bacterium]
AFVRRAWMDAYGALSHADQATPLGAEDLELLATSAYMLGRDDEYVSYLERAHHAYLGTGEPLRAVRCAFWVGMNLALRGEMAPASGWLGRAQRLVEREGRDCVEQGYLLLPLMFEYEAAGDYEAAAVTAADAAGIGERFGDADLFALAVQSQGILLVRLGRVDEGLGLLDEAMVAVTTGELSSIVSGFVYCGVIMGCQETYELRRAQEWTAALTRWCEQQPDMVSFTGQCLVHRAEIMQLHGAWPDALEEARRAGERCSQVRNQSAVAQAFYRQGEIYRLQGRFPAAEEAYREASRYGCEPQPGLALLRLAQGNGDAAAAAIRRAMGETTEPLKRARLLPACVEIMLAMGDVKEALHACRELAEISVRYDRGMLGAMVAHAEGEVDLAEGDARAALLALRRAWQMWQELEVPYEAARVRVLVGQACRALGDDDAAALELEAARDVFAQLGAAPDLARVDSLTQQAPSIDARGLTPRELQVLRLIATGETNKSIAAELVLSERTVDRHVSNIFAKLDVSSRTAAAAYAYEHQLA